MSDALTMEPEGGIDMAEEGSEDRSAVVDMNGSWVCEECKTVNIPSQWPDEISKDHCSECGAVMPATVEDDPGVDDEPFATATLTEDQIKNGLANMAGGVATAQDVENAARSEEGLDPLLPLDFGPFNADAALKAIFEKSAEIRVLQADYDRKKDVAKDAKTELDTASKALVNIIESLKNRRAHALDPSQPYLQDVSIQNSSCPWERSHPGQACPICSAAQAKDIVPSLESAVHPEHEGHEAIAEAAHVNNVERASDSQVAAAAGELGDSIAAAEPARILPARGSKKRAKKQPEEEREKQVASARKASTKPKAKAAKKGRHK